MDKLLNYSRRRIDSVLEQIDGLEGCEFPYRDSKDALNGIKQVFEYTLRALDRVGSDTEVIYVKELSATSLRTLFRCMPLLGFILRSTDVRNPFEAIGPLRDISKSALQKKTSQGSQDTKLLMSSEWDYSPITYPEIPELPGFVLIGLPASESDNPLLIPLAGHELGHSLWVAHKLENKFKGSFCRDIIRYIVANKTRYLGIFPNIGQEGSFKKTIKEQKAFPTWQYALSWVLNQAKESFCDFVGVYIFGTAYLESFAYLFAPNVKSPRSVYYPKAIKRVENIVKAAEKYGFSIPQNYLMRFSERPAPLLAPGEEFQLSMADAVLEKNIEGLMVKAEKMLRQANVPKSDDREVRRICKRFSLFVPAQECKTITDIINAAWRTYGDKVFWAKLPGLEQNKYRIMKDLVLKTIEIFEVEHILSGQI